MDFDITLFALRYAMNSGGLAMTKVSKYIIRHIDQISCEDLKSFLEEIQEYYADKSKERFQEATILTVAIKKELYGEVS